MTIAAWLTDIHLDCVQNPYTVMQALVKSSREADMLLISGDISVASSLRNHLRIIDEVAEKPVYFVLGNHDYYFGNVSDVRKSVRDTCQTSSYLRYLSNVSFVRLEPGIALVGHDGWYDARNGDYVQSPILMNDWVKISDYSIAHERVPNGIKISKDMIVEVARKLCAGAVQHIAAGIRAASKESTHILVMTHVPPFLESYVPDHRKGHDMYNAIPWYTSKAMGDMLYSASKAYPHVKFTVLSGHTHSQFRGNLRDNLEVKVGKSEYGSPQLSGIITI